MKIFSEHLAFSNEKCKKNAIRFFVVWYSSNISLLSKLWNTKNNTHQMVMFEQSAFNIRVC